MIAFVGISTLVIVTPGPDTAITIRNTLLGGRAGGLATALGVSTGQTIWALATSAGLTALLVASEPLFLAVKYAGAAYLVWLGVQSLRAAFWPAAADRTARASQGHGLAPQAAFGQGLLSDLSNPKMAAFFTSLLPQFVSRRRFRGARRARPGLQPDDVDLAGRICPRRRAHGRRAAPSLHPAYG